MCVHAQLIQLCPTLCNCMDCSPPGSSVHGISQARILKWVAMPSSRGPSQPRDRTHVSCVFCIAGRFFTTEPPGKPLTDLSPVLKKVLHIQEMLSQYLLSQQDLPSISWKWFHPSLVLPVQVNCRQWPPSTLPLLSRSGTIPQPGYRWYLSPCSRCSRIGAERLA